jgi:hypothetical protein
MKEQFFDKTRMQCRTADVFPLRGKYADYGTGSDTLE